MRTHLVSVVLVATTVLAMGADGRTNIKFRRFILDNGGLSSDQQTYIQEGFNAANDLAGKLDKMDFSGVAGKLASAASSYLGALGPFVGLVLALFGPAESPELQAIKKLFTTVENRFDQVDLQFSDLRRQIAFIPTQIAFNDIESNINAVQLQLITLSKVHSLQNYKYEANEFVNTYNRAYTSDGPKLYNSIMHGGLVRDGLFFEFMKFSQYDRKATQKFMLGTLNLLMRAAALEMAYREITSDPDTASDRRNWESMFSDVKTKMTNIDNEITNHYHPHAVKDIDDLAAQFPKGGLSNDEFATKLYNNLKDKYYWRDWFVIVAAVHGSDVFMAHACEYYQHNKNGRTIAVASVPKGKHLIDMTAAAHITHPLQLYRHVIAGHASTHDVYYCYDANTGFSHMPASATSQCTTYVAAGVFCSKTADAHIRPTQSNRLHTYTPHADVNTAFLFG